MVQEVAKEQSQVEGEKKKQRRAVFSGKKGEGGRTIEKRCFRVGRERREENRR